MDSTACIHLRTGVQVAMIWREALDSIQLPFPPHPFLNRQNCRPIPSSSRSNRTLTAQYQFLQVPNSPLPFSTLPKHFQFQIQRKWLQKKQKRCAGNPRESNFNSFVESYENFFGGDSATLCTRHSKSNTKGAPHTSKKGRQVLMEKYGRRRR